MNGHPRRAPTVDPRNLSPKEYDELLRRLLQVRNTRSPALARAAEIADRIATQYERRMNGGEPVLGPQ